MKNSKVFKRILAILISAMMLLSALPLGVFAAEPYSFEFKIEGDEATLVYCNPKSDNLEVVVPDTYEGKPVTAIGDGAFAGFGIHISDGADVKITNAKVTLPKTIKKIGFLAFGMAPVDVTNINELTNLEYIGAYAFMESLVSGNIVLPESVKYVGASAFTKTDITSLYLGKNVNIPQAETSNTAIQNAIKKSGYSSLIKNVTMSTADTDKSIALCCPELKKVTVDARNPYYRSVNGILYSKDMTKLYTYPSGKTNSIYIMPSTVDAFYNAFGGYYIYPMKIMGFTFDFFDKSNLIGNSSIFGQKKEEQNDNMLNAYKFASNLKTVVISDRVSEITDIAFYNTGIESVFIPKNVTKIAKKAFWHCTELTTVGFDRNSSFNTLPEECFKDCTSLKNVTFGKIKYLEALAFGNCSTLERIDLTNVLSIESTAFDGCTNLTDVVYQNTESEEKATVSAKAFDNMESLETVMLGSSVEKIEAQAFANCANLKTAYISDEIDSIDDTAFNGCDNLTIVCPTEECYAYSYAAANNIPVTTLQVMPIPNQTYTGDCIEPELTVKSSGKVLNQGSDYSTYYKDNTDAGLATATVMGEGSYSMFASVCKFAIVQRDINDGVEIGEIAPQELVDGKAEPEITLTYNGRQLEQGVDYELEYIDNTEAGTGMVAVMGKNNFVGVCTAEFEITDSAPKHTGDANNDGIIDANDYAMVKSYVLGNGILTEEESLFADVNKDGAVDAFDAIAIDGIIRGIIKMEDIAQ